MVAPVQAEFEQRLRARAALRHNDIAGGRVKQGFRMGSEFLRPGTILTREQILAIPYANRAALLARFIEVWPQEATKVDPSKVKRFMVHLGGGHYNVIEGVLLNEEPLTKERAEELRDGSG